MQDELNLTKRKVSELSKLEGTTQLYKQKCEDFSKLTTKVSDLEVQIEDLKNSLDDTNEENKALLSKISVYKEKIEAEKTKNITLDIELSKKKAEIEAMKNERKRLEITNSELEGKLNEQNKFFEKLQREQEYNTQHHRSTERAMNNMVGQDFQELMRGIEGQSETSRSLRNSNNSTAARDGEKEILEKENEILKAKCRETEFENQSLKERINRSEEIKLMDRLTRENQSLREDLEKSKKRKLSTNTEDSQLHNEIKNLKKV